MEEAPSAGCYGNPTCEFQLNLSSFNPAMIQFV